MIDLNNTGIIKYAVINSSYNSPVYSIPDTKQKDYYDNAQALTEEEKANLNPNKDNTMLYLGIGVGILALFLIIK